MGFSVKGKTSPLFLSLIAILAILLVWAVEASKRFHEDPLRSLKVQAAHKMGEAAAAIKEEKIRRGILVDPQNDPNQTGLIGKEYTDLTTTLGPLSAKRTSTNPNFAGLLVELLARAGAKPGDPVAVSLSGSFPALNIALFAAIDVMGLHPVIISSVGASTYGANEPELTWLDMERALREKGIFPYRSRAASLGGVAEGGGGLEGKGILLGMEAIGRNGIFYLDEQGRKTIAEDIERRMALYSRELGGRKPAAFINVGGTLTSLGDSPETLSLPTGLIYKLPPSRSPVRGIIYRMNEMGVPVIHLLNIKKMALKHGLPADPIPLPPVPSGRIMGPREYSYPLVLLGLALLVLSLGVVRFYRPSQPVLK